MEKNKAFATVKEFIAFLNKNRFDIREAYIFGSYISGNYNEDSDIDLAVVMRNLSNSFTMQVELMKIGRRFDSRIEPHPFDERDFNSSHPFASKILSTGVQVF